MKIEALVMERVEEILNLPERKRRESLHELDELATSILSPPMIFREHSASNYERM
jgi:hypothetical protein